MKTNKEKIIYRERLNKVLNLAWEIFKSQFIYNKISIKNEASFQLHFANIIYKVGELYSYSIDDVFQVDLETKYKTNENKTKYIDITCRFKEMSKCAIELKFKTESQGAYDNGRIDIYSDIKKIELLTTNKHSFGKFYMITNAIPYIKKSKRGVGTIFQTFNGFEIKKGKNFSYPNKGRENVSISFDSSYKFKWEQINEWYFVEFTINLKNKKAYTLEEKRKKHKRAYLPWTIEEDDKLQIYYCEGKTILELSEIFQRNKGAILSRIKKLEIKDKYES